GGERVGRDVECPELGALGEPIGFATADRHDLPGHSAAQQVGDEARAHVAGASDDDDSHDSSSASTAPGAGGRGGVFGSGHSPPPSMLSLPTFICCGRRVPLSVSSASPVKSRSSPVGSFVASSRASSGASMHAGYP